MLWDDRVIIAIAERLAIIAELHTSHSGMTKIDCCEKLSVAAGNGQRSGKNCASM